MTSKKETLKVYSTRLYKRHVHKIKDRAKVRGLAEAEYIRLVIDKTKL